jgi:hypothetical protein
MGTTPGARLTGSQLPLGYNVPEIWNRETLKIFDNILVMMSCVNRDYEGDIKKKGDVVHIRSESDIDIQDYARYQPLDTQDLEEAKTTLSIDQQKYFNVRLDDLDDADMDIPVMNKIVKRASIKLAKTVDTYLHGICIAGADTSNYLGTQTSPTAVSKTNVYDTFTEMFEVLRTADVIQYDSKPFAVIPPKLETIIKQCPEFIEKSTSKGDAQVRSGGIIGDLGGFDLKVTTNLAAYATGNKYKILFGTQRGCTFASKVAKIESYRHPDYFSDAVKGLYLYGAKVLYDNCLGVLFADL